MKQMVCSVCSYTYDESKGIPEAGIAPGTRWEDLPDPHRSRAGNGSSLPWS